MSGRAWALVRVVAGVAVLGVLAWRVGTGPFVTGLRAIGSGSVAASVVLVAGTTWCSAERWRLVARRAGVILTTREAVVAYYRSQFLNSVLPGGIVGDVHRAIAHRTVRSVVVERVLGQAVQIAVALMVVLVAWPADIAPSTPVLAMAAAAGIVALAGLVLVLTDRGLLDVENVPAVLGLSALAAAGHTTVFLIAARAVGVDASLGILAALAFVVLVAAALPTNVAGWGPREGAAAWAFALVGLGAATGTSVATAYGVLAMIATLPGAALLLLREKSDVDEQPQREAVGARG
ncbi:MAG: lysylphosphatidylglycerol synthase transmembrane domain-containing protein [Nocardioides sp.]